MEYEPGKIQKELSNSIEGLIENKRESRDLAQLGNEIKMHVYEFIMEKMFTTPEALDDEKEELEIEFLVKLEKALPDKKIKLLKQFVEFKRDKEMDLSWLMLVNTVDFMINYGNEVVSVLSGYYGPGANKGYEG